VQENVNTFSNEVQVFENQRETIRELLIDQRFQGVLNIEKKGYFPFQE
jgi:hypothetical protein